MHGQASHEPAGLLFRQALLMGAVAGILWFRYPLEGFLLFACLVWLYAGRAGSPFCFQTFNSCRSSHAGICALLLVASFLCGATYAHIRAPRAPAEPAWMSSLPGLAPVPEHSFMRPPTLAVHGRIAEVTPLAGNRLRLLLEEVRPLSSGNDGSEHGPNSAKNTHPYSAPILLTWYGPAGTITAGQTFSGTIRLSPVRSLANPGTHDSAAFHADRGIFYRAWTTEKPGSPPDAHVSGTGTWLARQRGRIQERFYAALPLSATLPACGKSTSRTYGFSSGSEQNNPPIYGTGAALLPALIMGDRSFLSTEQNDRIARSTLAHSISLSGLHLGYALILGYFFAGLTGWLFPRIHNRLPRPLLGMAVAFPLAIAYTWLGQAPVSLLRSLCMFLFFAVLLFAKRPKILLDGLLAAVFILLLLNPNALFDISLQLSALSVAVIALSLPGLQQSVRSLIPLTIPARGGMTFRARLGNSAKDMMRGCLLIFLLSLCIQAVLAPLTLRAFGTVGLWFPLNVLWLPVLGGLVMPLAFFGLFFSLVGLESIASAFLAGAAVPCQWLMDVLCWMDNAGILLAPVTLRPHSLTVAGYWMLCLSLPGLWYAWKAQHSRPCLRTDSQRTLTEKPTKTPLALSRAVFRHHGIVPAVGVLLFMAPLLVSIYKEQTRPVGVHVLDTAQGQAVLVTWPGGRALVDGGGISPLFDTGQNTISPALTDNERAQVNMLINTHPDFDHLDGLIYLLENHAVDQFIHNGDLPYGPLAARLGKAIDGRQWLLPVCRKAGESIPLDNSGAVFEVLWPLTCPEKLEEGHEIALPTVTRTLAERATMQGTGQEKTNDNSLVLRLVWQGRPLALLCGDAGQRPLRWLAREMPDKLRAEILVVPHHGSVTGMEPAFYEAVRPVAAIASCGYQNRWNFPAEKVRNALADRGIPLYTTALSGQIRLLWHSPDGPFTATGARPLEPLPVAP